MTSQVSHPSFGQLLDLEEFSFLFGNYVKEDKLPVHLSA